MPGTLTESLDNLYTSTWRGMREGVADQIFDHTPILYWLKSKGKMTTQAGGRTIERNLETANGATSQWLDKGDAVALNDIEHLTVAVYNWRYLDAPVVRFWQDDQKNRAQYQILNLMRSKLGNARKDLEQTLETRIAAGSGAASKAIDGLQLLVADNPSASASIGGIDQSTNSFWRNQSTDMTGESFSTFGVDRMETMFNNCGKNKKEENPDIIVTGQAPFEYYKSTRLGYTQAGFQKLVDMGFENAAFRGVPIVWSSAIADTRMYFLNTNHLEFVYDPAYYFEMGEWLPVTAQPNDRVAHITFVGQMVTDSRRTQGVIHSIDTP